MARKSHKLPAKESSSKMRKQCKIEHFFKKSPENHSGDRKDVNSVEVKKTCSSESPVNVHKRKRNPSNDSEGIESFFSKQNCLDTKSETSKSRGRTSLKTRLSLKRKKKKSEEQGGKLSNGVIEVIDITENGMEDCLTNSLVSKDQMESASLGLMLNPLSLDVNENDIELSNNHLVPNKTEVTPSTTTTQTLQHALPLDGNDKLCDDKLQSVLEGNILCSQSETNDSNSCRLNLNEPGTDKVLDSDIVKETVDCTSIDLSSESKSSKNMSKSLLAEQAGDKQQKQKPQLNLPDFGKPISSDSSSIDSSPVDGLESSVSKCKSDEFLDEGTGSQPQEMEADGDTDVKFRVPYYLENFMAMMSQVLEDDYYRSLFNEDDMEVVEKFNRLSEVAQKLYVRMFSRKLMWRMQIKIKYPEIAENLSSFINELIEAGLAHSEQNLTSLEETLHLLPSADLRTVAKSFYHNCSNQTKVQIVDLLLKHCKQQSVRSLFEPNGLQTVEKSMMNRAKKLLGPCFKLVESHRSVFVRLLTLFSLCVNSMDDETGGAISAQLFQMLQVNIGRVVFPTYKIHRQTEIFQSRNDLIRYGDAIQLDSEMVSRMEKKDLSGAYEVYLKAKMLYDDNKKDKRIKMWDKKLPLFLRHCTTGYVCSHILFQGVELLQRQRNYKDAVAILEELLSQDIYGCSHRGRWYDRLALNLDQHLQSPGKALDIIEKGLKDSLVSVGHRYSLYLRAEKICKDSKSRWHKRLKKLKHEPVVEAPKVFITGKTLECGLPGVRYRFITNNYDATDGTSSEDVVMCPVEILVLNHYMNNGYPQGLHAEGSIMHFLFALFFFDILYMDIPDVFISPFQACPLDMASPDFYLNRKEAIDERLQFISTASLQELNEQIAKVWEDNYGCMLAGGKWEMFNSLSELQGLVSCMEGKILAGIFGRYAKNPRHTRSGFPDLTLWNVNTKKFKISEVKGPGDRLSTKQMLWLDYLIKLGVDAEVSHIKPVGTKKLQPQSE
ncbi:fanconi-associated nuclease 1 [Octopus bimaculoides]|uniref:Fanconi-associated nuclease n=1 Tax=Octopus bimaculoides TaxID=37653 RepID=A0A0L8HWY7_OCTBM|nr:fanconi-associated nuclease 1 [Octopus bimaculoides]|eukprot:XP_014768704.1 PREDICTED: fanconi-associated nuclease 1-like isoform X2 [Octopus bimaculoides]